MCVCVTGQWTHPGGRTWLNTVITSSAVPYGTRQSNPSQVSPSLPLSHTHTLPLRLLIPLSLSLSWVLNSAAVIKILADPQKIQAFSLISNENFQSVKCDCKVTL